MPPESGILVESRIRVKSLDPSGIPYSVVDHSHLSLSSISFGLYLFERVSEQMYRHTGVNRWRFQARTSAVHCQCLHVENGDRSKKG